MLTYILNFRLIYVLIKVNGKPAHPFLNNMLEDVNEANAGFLSLLMFAIIAMYLLFAAFKGNVKFGLRCLCVTFYPLE
jgi:hypothetical protein